MGNMSNLPEDIILDIIARLPTESILDCKLVCKPWKNLVSHHPSFSQMHLNYFDCSTDSDKLSFLVLDRNQDLYYFEYHESQDGTPVHNTRRLNLIVPNMYCHYRIVGSFNGLVCIYGWRRSIPTCICNPVTKEYVMLPECIPDCGNNYIDSVEGFGYLSSTNEYKVIELYINYKFIDVAVYTLGSGEGWRNVGRFDSEFPSLDNLPGVFMRGALYWMDGLGESVYIFDLTEEQLGEYVSGPPLPPEADEWNAYWPYSMGNLDGDLYCAMRDYNGKAKCFDIWLLKQKNHIHDTTEQVEHEPLGWSREFLLPKKQPLAITKSGGVLCYDYDSLVIYDVIASTSNILVDFIAFKKMLPHKNTLVSLKELGEEDIKIMESGESKEIESCVLKA